MSQDSDHANHEANTSATASLFRSEVLLAKSQRNYGEVLLLNPVSLQVLTGVFASLALALIGFVFLFGFHRKVTVAGTVEPDLGLIALHASQSGVIEARLVKEGDQVVQGTPLFRIGAERRSVALGDTAVELGRLLQQRRDSLATDQTRLMSQAGLRHEASLRRLGQDHEDLARIDAEILLQRRRIDLAQNEVERTTALNRQGFLAAAVLQDKEAALIDQREKLGELDGARLAALRDEQSLRAEMAQQATQRLRDVDALARSINEIEGQITENETGRAILVTAPLAGSVDVLNADVGDTVSANQSLGAMLPEHARLEALLYAPSSAAGFIRPGMDVLLRYESFPYQKFGLAHGTVRSIANAAIEARSVAGAESATANPEPVYRVRVTLDRADVQVGDGSLPLKPGMHLDASVVLEERRLYEWILEPVYALRGRI